MRGMRTLKDRIPHLLGITVIGANHRPPVHAGQRGEQLTHAATTTAHTLRGGDGGGSGQGPSLRGSDD